MKPILWGSWKLCRGGLKFQAVLSNPEALNNLNSIYKFKFCSTGSTQHIRYEIKSVGNIKKDNTYKHTHTPITSKGLRTVYFLPEFLMYAFSKFSFVINESENSQMRSIYLIYLLTYIMKLSRISGYVASNGILVTELSIGKNVERSIHDLIWRTTLECAWRGWENSWKSLEISVGFWVSSWDLLNAYHECWPFDLNLW